MGTKIKLVYEFKKRSETMIQLDGIKTAIPKLRETLIEVGDSL